MLDNHLPGVSGIDAVQDLRRLAPQARVLLLTVSEDAQDLARALRHGAQGYLLKTIDGDLLAEAIQRAACGEPVVSPELMGKLVMAFQSQGVPSVPSAPLAPPALASVRPNAALVAALSPREEEVLREIARGASNKEIADFCENTFGVKFPMFAKSSVKGADASPLYRQLAQLSGTAPKWNFHKYLLGRDGKLVDHYSSMTSPYSETLISAIEQLLTAPAPR